MTARSGLRRQRQRTRSRSSARRRSDRSRARDSDRQTSAPRPSTGARQQPTGLSRRTARHEAVAAVLLMLARARTSDIGAMPHAGSAASTGCLRAAEGPARSNQSLGVFASPLPMRASAPTQVENYRSYRRQEFANGTATARADGRMRASPAAPWQALSRDDERAPPLATARDARWTRTRRPCRPRWRVLLCPKRRRQLRQTRVRHGCAPRRSDTSGHAAVAAESPSSWSEGRGLRNRGTAAACLHRRAGCSQPGPLG